MNKIALFMTLIFNSFSFIYAEPATTAPDFSENTEQQPPSLKERCAACHGLDGAQSVDPTIPKLAAQQFDYLQLQLINFAKAEQGPRYNPIMTALAAELSPEERQEISQHYASQRHSYNVTPHRDDLEFGERLYKGGDQKKLIMACSCCHQPQAHGYAPAIVPSLAGQYAEYLIEQLKQYRSGHRTHPMMTPIAQRLSDEQIEAVSYYLQGVQPQ